MVPPLPHERRSPLHVGPRLLRLGGARGGVGSVEEVETDGAGQPSTSAHLCPSPGGGAQEEEAWLMTELSKNQVDEKSTSIICFLQFCSFFVENKCQKKILFE